MIESAKFVRKPFEVDAVQVTDDNIHDVAKWCMGDVVPPTDNQKDSYIHVRVLRPLTERQTRAFTGDWVLYAGKGFKVYTDKAFKSNFNAKE